MLSPLPRRSGWAYSSLCFTQPYQPSPKGLSGRPAHCPFRRLLSVHSRYGLHTRAVTNSRHANRRLQPLRYLHDCSDCFRLERLPGGACTHWKAPPFHGARHRRSFQELPLRDQISTSDRDRKPLRISRTRNGQRSRFTRLGGEANCGIGSAEPLVVAALDDLEEKALIERMGVDLEEFAIAFAVVQNLVVAKGCHRWRIEIVFGLDIVVIIVRDFEEICAAGAHVGNRRENIVARKGNVLDSGAEEFVNKASRKRSRGR